MRTIVDIPEKQINALDDLGRIRKCSRAALVREAVEEYLVEQAGNQTDKAFGLWKGKGVDALAVQNILRSEWGE